MITLHRCDECGEDRPAYTRAGRIFDVYGHAMEATRYFSEADVRKLWDGFQEAKSWVEIITPVNASILEAAENFSAPEDWS